MWQLVETVGTLLKGEEQTRNAPGSWAPHPLLPEVRGTALPLTSPGLWTVGNFSAFLASSEVTCKVALPSRKKTSDPSVVAAVNNGSRRVRKPGSAKGRTDAVCLKLTSLGPRADSFRCACTRGPTHSVLTAKGRTAVNGAAVSTAV